MRKMKPEPKQRLIEEFSDLSLRRGKLLAFLEKMRTSQDLDVRLLRRQYKVMGEYADILETRIKLDDAKVVGAE